MCSFQTETINGFDTTNWLLRYKCYFDATSIKCKSPMIHHNSKQTFTAAGVSDFLFRTSVARFLAHTSKYLDVPWLLMFSSQGVPVTQVAWCRSPSQSKYAIENIQFFLGRISSKSLIFQTQTGELAALAQSDKPRFKRDGIFEPQNVQAPVWGLRRELPVLFKICTR